MISATPEVWAAVSRPSIRKSKIIARLSAPVDGGSSEVRYLNEYHPKLSPITWSIASIPNGWRGMRATLTLDNSSGDLSAFKSDGLFGPGTSDRMLGGLAEISVSQAIAYGRQTFEIPVYTGVVSEIEWGNHGATAQVLMQDRLSESLKLTTGSAFTIDRSFNLLDNALTFIRDHAGIDTASSVVTSTRDYLFQILDDLEWYGLGLIEQGQNVSNVFGALCRSCLCQPVLREDGLLDFVHEWPLGLSGELDVETTFPTAVTDRNANLGGFRRANGRFTDIRVDYQNVSDVLPLDRNGNLFANDTVLAYSAPYIQSLRQAATIEGLLYPIVRRSEDLISFRTAGLGMLIQPGDVVPVEYGGARHLYRVMTKRWTEDSIDCEAYRYQQRDEVQNAALQTWGAAWSSTTAWM